MFESDDVKEVCAEAKAPASAPRLSARSSGCARRTSEREEEESILDLYKAALGMA
jgi:uncharacterized protein (UPF0335 family)